MDKILKTGCVFVVVMLLSITGCARHKVCDNAAPCRKESLTPTATTDEVIQKSSSAKPVFDEDIAEFALLDEDEPAANEPIQQPSQPEKVAEEQKNVVPEEVNDFAWIEDEEQQDETLQAVYFDFDKYNVRKDQEPTLEKNMNVIKKELSENKQCKIVVEGHACSSAGSAAYNMALSERRAKVVSDRLAKEGISHNQIKIVGRGQEYPAIANGKPVTGNREQQSLNRRDEFRMLTA